MESEKYMNTKTVHPHTLAEVLYVFYHYMKNQSAIVNYNYYKNVSLKKFYTIKEILNNHWKYLNMIFT